MLKVSFIVEDFNSKKFGPITTFVELDTILLDAAKGAGIPILHSCDGCCACSTCHVIPLCGFESLSEMHVSEEDRLDFSWGVCEKSRLSCQAKIIGEGLLIFIPKHSIDPYESVEFFKNMLDKLPKLDWYDSEEIAESLEMMYKHIDLLNLRLSELLEYLKFMPNFVGDINISNEKMLEAILQEWMDIRGIN